MPIKPERRFLYPIDWEQLSYEIRFRRAGGACEGCGRRHGDPIRLRSDGSWTKVIISCAHLDQDTSNNAPQNLKAFCQFCHLAHDRLDNIIRRRITLKKRKALGDLFLGPYPLLY